MDADYIIVGQSYKVTAQGTTNREWWTVKSKKLNGRGDWEITCTKQGAASPRIFRPEHFKDMKKKAEIISEGVELLTEMDGAEMWVERIDYMPFHEKRGRKRKSDLVSA